MTLQTLSLKKDTLERIYGSDKEGVEKLKHYEEKFNEGEETRDYEALLKDNFISSLFAYYQFFEFVSKNLDTKSAAIADTILSKSASRYFKITQKQRYVIAKAVSERYTCEQLIDAIAK